MAKKTTRSKKTSKTLKPTTSTTKKTKVSLPDRYTVLSIAGCISEKHKISKKQVKDIMDDIFTVISSGVMKGERVPVGKMGKLYVRIRPARKARKGRNPATGAEITIPAKRATKVPKMSFSKDFKEKVLKAKIK